MADSRFFERAGPFTLRQLAEIGEAELQGSGQEDRLIVDVASLDGAGADRISFLDNRKYVKALKTTEAGAVVLSQDDAPNAPDATACLVSRSPYRSFALISQAFYPKPEVEPEVHPSAVIPATARVAASARLDAGVVLGEEVAIGEGSHLGPNVVIGQGVTVGRNTRIGPNVSLECCDIGENVQIHAGARVGTRGFGFAMDPRGHVELPQTGRVIVGNDVEIGANSTIDRGMGPDTVIGDGCKIDNLVQIGHNVKLGKNCVIAALSGIAGSAEFEDFVICAAKVGVAGHLTIGAGTRIAAMSGITKSVPAGSTIAGVPASDHKEWLRKNVLLNRMVKDRG